MRTSVSWPPGRIKTSLPRRPSWSPLLVPRALSSNASTAGAGSNFSPPLDLPSEGHDQCVEVLVAAMHGHAGDVPCELHVYPGVPPAQYYCREQVSWSCDKIKI